MKKMQFLIFIYALLAIALLAQDEPPIRVETNLVNLGVSVIDGKGKNVEGLKKEQFEVFDNGAKQAIAIFSAETAPISYGIIYDMHPTTEERTEAVLESLREFSKKLRANDDLFTLVFNQRGSLTLDFIPTAAQIKSNLSGKYSEPNSLYDAISAAAKKIAAGRNLKRVLIVITDSADHSSKKRFTNIQEELKALDAQIYGILWDEADEWGYSDITRDEKKRRASSDASRLDKAALQALALRTGGTVNSPAVQNAGELFRIYSDIAFETSKQYTLGFYPETIDGKYHNLLIKIKSSRDSKNWSLSYRPGYQSIKKN